MMPKHFHLRLSKRAMHSPVTHSVTLRGALTDEGVDAFFWSDGSRHLALVADRASNHGVSATNGYADYAEVVRRAVGERISVRAMNGIRWFELDSTGSFDEVQLDGDQVGFAPITQPGHQPRSFEAFLTLTDLLAPASRAYWVRVVQLEALAT